MSGFDALVDDVLSAGQILWRRGPEAAASQAGVSAQGAMIEEAAFQALYRRTAPALRAYAARVLGSATYADDIVQDAYLRLVRSPPATADPQELRALLFRIASRLIVDHWRRRRVEGGHAARSETVAVVPAADIPLRVDMARVFEQLNPQQRQLLWLAYVEGADHREIAGALGLREGSVRVLLHRARRKLARFLREGGHGPNQQHGDR